MTLQDEAKLYVEALQSPANAWGVQMVPYMGFINRKVQKKWTTSDSFRAYMYQRHGIQKTDKAIEEVLESV